MDKSISNIKARRIFKNVTSSVKDGSSNNLKTIDINIEEMPTGEISAGAGSELMEEHLHLKFQKIIGSVKESRLIFHLIQMKKVSKED